MGPDVLRFRRNLLHTHAFYLLNIFRLFVTMPSLYTLAIKFKGDFELRIDLVPVSQLKVDVS